MNSKYFRLAYGLVTIVCMAACGNDFPNNALVIPANYTQYRSAQVIGNDYLVFRGAYNPAVPNGSGTNVVYIAQFLSRVPASPQPSLLDGTTWVGRSGDSQASQLTITISSDSIILTLDCYVSGTNILKGTNSITLPVDLDGNKIYLQDVFRLVNNSDTDVFNYCSFGLSADYLSFSSATGTASVRSGKGILIGTFVKTP